MSRPPEPCHQDSPRFLRKLAVFLLGLNILGGIYLVLSDGGALELLPASDPKEARSIVPETQAAILHPIERIAYSNDWRLETQRTVKAGGHTFAIIRTGMDSCLPISTDVSNVRLYVMHPTLIESPSSKGGKTGTFYEALLPRNAATCANSRYVFAEWKSAESGLAEMMVGEQKLAIDVRVSGELSAPKRSLFVASTNSYLLKGHCDKYCPRESELAHKYGRMLASHGVQPMQNWIGNPPVRKGVLDLDRWSKKSMSFRQTTMAYAKSGLVGFPRMDGYRDKVAYLRALEATVQKEKLQGKAWVYAVDEPTVNDRLVEKLKLYKLLAPSVKVMVTTAYDPKLANVVDIFAPVFNRFVKIDQAKRKLYQGKQLWSYASCMGSCGPNRKTDINVPKRPGGDTRLADFLIDRPAARLFQFFKSLDAANADGAIYYEATEGYPLMRKGVNLISDPWNFGGNGDGLLLYPGRPGSYGLQQHQPIPSLRLKFIRHAIENYW